jgi:putative ABC transport system permease protein
MRNPLNRRLGRQLVHDAGKYLGIFALLLVTIAVISGFLATLSSIRGILSDMDEANAVEDARFATSTAIDDAARGAVEDEGAAVYDIWSRDAPATVGGAEATVRLYVTRTEVDAPSYYEGRAPTAADEVALDHTFCANHGIAVGDVVDLDARAFTVCGIMVLPDYTSLMRSNNDFVMDANTFSVGLVSEDGFARFADLPTTYAYALLFDDPALTTSGRFEREMAIAQALTDAGATVTDLLDRDQNQGISYLTTDMQGDGAMYTTFLYVLIAIMAFVFVILTNATIEKESSVIGTLLASGWRKAEILRHYLLLPALVGLVACALGNVLGYTLISDVTQGLYYNSYSIPPFHMTFDAGTFVMTSVVPYALLVGVTLVGLARKLRATPLAFLRHEVSRGRRHRGPRLPARLGYVSRFRIRLLARNAPHARHALPGGHRR